MKVLLINPSWDSLVSKKAGQYEITELSPEAYIKEHSIKDLEGTVRKAFKKFYIRPAYAFSRIIEGNPTVWNK